MTKQYIKLPFAPLDQFLDSYGSSSASKGEAIGISGDAYSKYQAKETLTWYSADKFAIALGIHPVLIWNDWYTITTEGN